MPARWRVAPSSTGAGMVDQSGASIVPVMSFNHAVLGAVEELGHERRPSSLVARSEARPGVTVEILVEQQPIAGAVAAWQRAATEERAAVLRIGQEDALKA